MKNLIILAALFLFSSQLVTAQLIERKNPLGGEITGDYFGTQDDLKRVEVKLQLRQSTDPDALQPNIGINDCHLRVTSVKLTNGNTVDVSNKDVVLSTILVNPLMLSFSLPISPNNSISSNAYYLPRAWSKFDYEISCNVAGDQAVKRLSSYSKPASAVQRQVSIQIGKPIVHSSSNDRIIIPFLSEKSLKLSVKMKLAGSDVATGTDVLIGGRWTPIQLTVSNPIAVNNTYAIEVSFPDFEEDLVSANISDTPDYLKNIKGSSAEWRSTWTNVFTLTPATQTSLSDIKISSASSGHAINVDTTDDVEELTMKLADRVVAQKCGNKAPGVQSCTFTLTREEIPEGTSAITFEGKSLAGLSFATPTTPLRITKRAKPEIVGTPTFLIQDNNFKMSYKIRGDLSTVTASIIYENGAVPATSAWSETKNCGVADGLGVRSCDFVLSPAGLAISPSDREKSEIPVKLQIDAKDTVGALYENLDSLSFRLVNKEVVEKRLQEIEKEWKLNEDTAQTIEKIAILLFADKTKVSDPTVKETFNAIKKGNNDGRHQVLFGILKAIGSTLLNSFGIPIKFGP